MAAKKPTLAGEWAVLLKYYDVKKSSDIHLSYYDGECTIRVGTVRDVFFPLDSDYSRDNFVGCCGVGVFHDFGPFYAQRYQKALNFVFFNDPMYRTHHKAIEVATTIPSQRAAIELLKHVGFTPSKSAYNSGSGNTITLWTWVNPKKRRK